jgi:uncharacterized membrane protein/glutaredoxin
MARFRSASRLDLHLTWYTALLLLVAGLSFTHARAQTAESPVVRAVLFTNPVCTFCRQIVDKDLPPAIQEFGTQLEMLTVDVNTPEGKALYEAALEAFGVPRGVPLLFIGDTTLGGVNIVPKLPALVETYLAQGGLDWPAIPGLGEYMAALQVSITLPTPTPQVIPTLTPAATPASPLVSATLFWMDGCPHCDEVIEIVLPPLQEKYGPQLDIQRVEVVSMDDVNRLYALGEAYGLPRDQVGVPLLIIGSHVLLGAEQIPAELPGLIDDYLAKGGVALPDVSAYFDATTSAEPAPAGPPDGYWMAMGVLVFMLAALLYTLAALFWKKLPAPTERWAQVALPLLALVGLGVAGYLSYIKTQELSAVCGPVGDCNAVQASPYARLFGILPIGVLGMAGYLLILAAWAWNRLRRSRLADLAPLAMFGMALFGVLFSLYLTYLELFVIRAVCLWCVTSAIIMTLIMILALSPARNLRRLAC